ncbi:hypothetical protein JCM16408A_46780 [Methylobacterium phyllosphaerae]
MPEVQRSPFKRMYELTILLLDFKELAVIGAHIATELPIMNGRAADMAEAIPEAI